MSKGLGRAQALLLRALASLEAEHGAAGRFYVWKILERARALSEPLRLREAAIKADIAARRAARLKAAEGGDDIARQMLELEAAFGAHARGHRSARTRRQDYGYIEDINPSRALASLAKRGLVTRKAIRGGGSAGLTPAGREEVRRHLARAA